HLLNPVHAMLRRDSEVPATRASRGFPAHGIGSNGIAETRAMLLPVDAEAPVAHTEHEACLDQHPSVALEILLDSCAAKACSLGHYLGAGASAESRSGQHVLRRRHRLLENLRIDFAIERVVRAAVTLIGDRPFAVTEVLCQRE